MPLRVAAIEFLNAAPLMWGLAEDARFRLFHTLPSACAEALRQGEADLGVIPAIELARIPGLMGLSGLGVASASGEGDAARSEVRSILLVSRRRPEAVRTVALDRASRTSAALALVLLRRRFGSPAEAVAGDADWGAGLERADAALVIGDPALRLRVSGAAEAAGCEVRDLAREWWQWTGLPFVFALWGVRAAIWREHGGWLGACLNQTLERGLAHREELVATWAPRLRLPEAEVRRYLETNVRYRLTPAHAAGWRHFLELAAAEGLIAGGMPELARVEAEA